MRRLIGVSFVDLNTYTVRIMHTEFDRIEKWNLEKRLILKCEGLHMLEYHALKTSECR